MRERAAAGGRGQMARVLNVAGETLPCVRRYGHDCIRIRIYRD